MQLLTSCYCFDNIIYEQIDGVNRERPIPLSSANMTWLENSVVHKLTAVEMIKFHWNSQHPFLVKPAWYHVYTI